MDLKFIVVTFNRRLTIFGYYNYMPNPRDPLGIPVNSSIQSRYRETCLKTPDGAPTVPQGVIPQDTIPVKIRAPSVPCTMGPPESPEHAEILSSNGPVQKFVSSTRLPFRPKAVMAARQIKMSNLVKTILCNSFAAPPPVGAVLPHPDRTPVSPSNGMWPSSGS